MGRVEYRYANAAAGVWRKYPKIVGYEEYSDPQVASDFPQFYSRFGYVERPGLRWRWLANGTDAYVCTSGSTWTRKAAKAAVIDARTHPERYEWR